MARNASFVCADGYFACRIARLLKESSASWPMLSETTGSPVSPPAFGEDKLTDHTLHDTALEVLASHRRLRDISAAYAREWPRLSDRLRPILPSLPMDIQETVERDMTLIRETLLDADERLAKSASALLVAVDVGGSNVALPAQIVCRLEMISQYVIRRVTSNVVYLPARRQRPARQDAATIAGQCRIADAENRVLDQTLDELETGLGQLAGVLEHSAAMDA
jgi:hypothetical protein